MTTVVPIWFSVLLLATLGLPVALACALVTVPSWRVPLVRAAAWSALPALALAIFAEPDYSVEVPWLLLGAQLGIDATGQVFLLFTSLVWLASGIYALTYLAHDERRPAFSVFFLLAMTGNLGLIVAQDMVTFYLFFALMSFSSYVLVVHHGDAEALYAGRVYLVLVVLGEVCLFSAVVMLVGATGRYQFPPLALGMPPPPRFDLIVALMLVGLGIKVGAVPLHVWLPLAHPAAPTPASAVLSGTMIKAGLLAWMRFLPLGEVEMPVHGTAVLIVGFVSTFYGALCGVLQSNAKTALAYSSISQMGMMTVGVGAALLAPAVWPATAIALAVYAAHHGLAKGALFLGVGVAGAVTTARQRVWVMGLLLLPALALCGMPLSSGAMAKIGLKYAASDVPTPWSDWLEPLLSLAAVGTTMVMARFFVDVWPRTHERRQSIPAGIVLPWLTVVAASAVGLGVLARAYLPEFFQQSSHQLLLPSTIATSLWPPVVGVALALAAWRLRGPLRLAQRGDPIPAGDLLSIGEWLAAGVWRRRPRGMAARLASYRTHIVAAWYSQRRQMWLFRASAALERRLFQWMTGGLLFVVLAIALYVLLSRT